MRDRAEKLVILAPSDYAQFPNGGTKAFIHEFLLALPQAAADRTTLVGVSADGPTRDDRRVGNRVFPFLRLGKWLGPKSGSLRMAFLKSLWLRWDMIRELQPDIIYAHNVETAALCATRGFTGRLVLHCHGLDNPIRLGRFREMRTGLPVWLYDRLVLPLALKNAACVFVTASQEDLRTFHARHRWNPSRALMRIPAMVDEHIFVPHDRPEARARLGVSDDAAVGIVVGRLEENKGVQTVIDAVKILKKGGLQFHLLVAGDGSYRHRLADYAALGGLGDSIQFLGHVERETLPLALSAADVYMSGSWKEGFSMALVEALACGVPAVVTNVGSAREVIRTGETGYLVSVGDGEAMARCVEAILIRRGTLELKCKASVSRFRSQTVVEGMLPMLGMAASS